MRVGCCQKQDLRDGEDSQDGLVWGWRLLSESRFGGFSGSGQSKGPGGECDVSTPATGRTAVGCPSRRSHQSHGWFPFFSGRNSKVLPLPEFAIQSRHAKAACQLRWFVACVQQITRCCCIARVQALGTRRYSSTRYIHHTYHGVGLSPMEGGGRSSLQPPSSGD